MAPDEQREVRAGMLTLRTLTNGRTRIIGLVGELDLANAEALESALEEALADREREVVIDMGELTFIDSTGIALIVAALGRSSSTRLRFVPSEALEVRKVLELTGIAERLPLADGQLDGGINPATPA